MENIKKKFQPQCLYEKASIPMKREVAPIVKQRNSHAGLKPTVADKCFSGASEKELDGQVTDNRS